MNLKVNDKEFNDIQHLVGGFITKEQDGELKYNLIASPDLPFNVAMQLLQTVTYQVLTAFAEQKPEALNDIYDAYNFMASTLLEYLIPDRELRPDITNDAILELEAKKIEEEYAKLTPEQKEQALKNIEELKEKLSNVKTDNKEV